MNVIIEKADVRLDQYLANALEISRSKVQKLMKDGRITIDEVPVFANKKGKLGEVVEVSDDLTFEIDITGEDIPLKVIYEDDDLLIINKASGMVVHPAPGNYTGTLVNALIYKFSLSKGSSNIRPGIVHRLDKDTSGLMVVAKNDNVHEKLSVMMKLKTVERKYLALVSGLIMHETGTIDAPIGRDPDNRQKMKVTDQNSKNAVTHFTVLKRYKDKTLIECKLETGRTHQIRVHLAYIGYPVFNDPVYGRRGKTTEFGQFLHSRSIRFIHPITKKELFFEVDPPEEFTDYLKELELEA
ncbi:MAG: RluA family pseudouridine synthase [Bacilli bacterium]